MLTNEGFAGKGENIGLTSMTRKTFENMVEIAFYVILPQCFIPLQ
jgi:hypothetical protein